MGKWARRVEIRALIGKLAWHVPQQLAPLLVQQFLGQFAGQTAGQFLGQFAGQFTWLFEKGSSLTPPEQPREAANRLLVWKDEQEELLSAHSISIPSVS